MNGDSSAPESSERASKRVKIEGNDGESANAEAVTSTSKLEPVTAKDEGEEPKNGKEEADDDDDDDEYAAYSAAAAQAEAVAPSGDLYLDTVSFEALFEWATSYSVLQQLQINRSVLDFDFERLCSVSLSNINVYACLVCGKYFQGRGKSSHAYAHSIHDDHHVFINLQTLKVSLE